MENSNIVIVLGVVGSVASVIGLLIAAPGIKSRLIHVAYGLAITVVSSLAVGYYTQVAQIHRMEKEAQAILDSSDRSSAGSMDGFMLASLSFLEKYKSQLPDTYARAEKVAEASGLYASGGSDSNEIDHFANLQQGSSAMYYLLTGVAASNGGKR
jgi:hypothetical protein